MRISPICSIASHGANSNLDLLLEAYGGFNWAEFPLTGGDVGGLKYFVPFLLLL